MLIQGTKKLLDQLKLKPADLTVLPEEEALFCWHANLVIINRRKAVILMQDTSRYIVVLWGMKQKEFQKIDDWIIEAIRQTMLAEQIKPELVERYLNEAGPVRFGKTKNRSHVAQLNLAIKELSFWEEELNPETIIQIDAAIRSGKRLVGDGSGSYRYPNEWFYSEFKKRYGEAVFSCPMAELEVQLQLEGKPTIRQLSVPLSRTFEELHEILQASFGWQNSHLHEFSFTAQNGRPRTRLVMDEEAFEYAIGAEKLIRDHEVTLADYLTEGLLFQYIYDFGDHWEHNILVKKISAAGEFNHPICTKIEGTTPPEDVGGRYGYEDFLSIIGDSENEAYENMRKWAKMQGYSEPNSKRINHDLKGL
ncbi:plasmid pRiA4b ORF-3 family protein [Carnobacterium antarcticum]|uniref:Plasmid pRiA4b ORF-3 family protein n=1 Tax=Carnobacterium antarcticum TaxID=2126436 RepID=A0ABW4NMQ1_9LACT|nr:plasmid pRiA4b ORF-3 family protein [Carnobacterium sp. CP1]ALV22173.1 plasmid pRiA4b ORF-3 family protein [Carnobacterium sp. CP1]